MSTATLTRMIIPKVIGGVTIDPEQWQRAAEYMSAIHGADMVEVSWRSVKSPKAVRAAHRDKTLTSFTSATVGRGVKYGEHPDNAGRETGELPYGEWLVEDHLIWHAGQILVRLYCVAGSLETVYSADGKSITRDEFRAWTYQRKGRPTAGCINVKIQNLTVHA